MTLLTPQQVAITGTAPTYAAVTSSDTFNHDSRAFLHVKNGSGSSINVTVVSPGTLRGQNYNPPVVAVPAGTDRFIGPFDIGLQDPTTGVITVTYSSITSVTAALIRS